MISPTAAAGRDHHTQDLQGQFGLTYLFVAHNLSVVKHKFDDPRLLRHLG